MSLTNFVQMRLQAGITASATSMVVFTPAAPFKLPDGSGTLVLLDGLTHPTKAEIITYSGLTDNGNGTHTVSGLVRGAEGTSAQVWSAQAYAIESVTAGVLAGLLGGKQATNANLDALAGLVGVADRVPYFTGAGALSLATLTAFGRSLIDDADASAARTTLDLVKQTSATDATTGRLLTVGAFGIGGGSIGSGDWNALTASGIYHSSTSGTTGIPVAVAGLMLFHMQYGISGGASQIAMQRTTSRVWTRVQSGGVWSAWVEVQTSANVQTSTTDTTAGRLLTVGAFGWGDTTAISLPSSTLDSATIPTGTYRVANTTAGTWPVGEFSPFTGVVSIERTNSGDTFQILKNTSIGRMWVRNVRSIELNKPWVEVYTSGNILGTVSQSAGVPTGAIIERGSNANGEYVRFADGTQICTIQKLTSDMTSTSITVSNTGGGFRSSQTSFSYPASFVAEPVVSGGVANNSQGVRGLAHRGGVSSTQFTLWTPGNAIPAPATYKLEITAIGRWY